MSKLADIFRPRVREADDDGVVVPMPLPAARLNAVAHAAASEDHSAQHVNTRAEAAFHRSEESEALHRLLADTRRKFDDLESLKSAIDEMALPFRGAMRALDQERALSTNLARQLSEKAATSDKLRDELQHAESKARLLEGEAENLRDALDQARESSYAAENARSLLTDEIKRRDAKIAALERQLEQEALQRRSFSESCHILQDQMLQAEKRVAELQDALVYAGERCETLKNDKRSLWHSAELARAEAERVNRRLAEGESALSAIRVELGKVEARHGEICAERNRLANAVDELREQQKAERLQMDVRVEALAARVVAADKQVAEMRQRLIERTEEARAFICKAAEATIARAAAERRLAALQVSQGLRGAVAEDPAEARTALSEFLRALNLKSREMALASSAEKMVALSERKGRATDDRRTVRAEADKRAEDLVSVFEDDRPRRSEIEKALDAAREVNARLESEVRILSAELHNPAGNTKQADTEPTAVERPKNRAGTARAGGLGHESGLVAHLRGPAKDDDPGRSVA